MPYYKIITIYGHCSFSVVSIYYIQRNETQEKNNYIYNVYSKKLYFTAVKI